MTETVIVTENSAAETPAAEAPAVEAAAEAAVEIAQIEADRDVAIAEIQAETAETAIEAAAESDAEQAEEDEQFDDLAEGLEECRQNIVTIQAQQSETVALLSSILERLPPAQPPQPEPNPEQESVNADGPQAAETPEAPPPARPKARWL